MTCQIILIISIGFVCVVILFYKTALFSHDHSYNSKQAGICQGFLLLTPCYLGLFKPGFILKILKPSSTLNLCSTIPIPRKFDHAGLPNLLQYSSVRRTRIVDLYIVRLLLIRIEICRTFIRSSDDNRSVRTCKKGGLCTFFTCRTCAFKFTLDYVRLFAAETLRGQNVASFVTICNCCKSWDASNLVTVSCLMISPTRTHTCCSDPN